MSTPIANVRISKFGEMSVEEEIPSLGVCDCVRWLGAASPFGLALPNAIPSPAHLYGPRGVWMDRQRVIACDSGNHRILIWNEIPTEDHQAAAIVLGQPSFESEGPAAGGKGPANGLFLPTGVLVTEGRLVVADAWHHRILVWNEVPKQSHTPPDYAIGQNDLNSVAPNRGLPPDRSSLYWPYGIAMLDDTFWVADTGNRRVLGWGRFPSQNLPCDYVLGQPDASSVDENRGGAVSNQSFRWPHDLCGNREWMFVADAGNHRLLGWRGSIEGDRPADIAIGQPDFQTNTESPYRSQGPCRLRFPYAVDLDGDLLAVADTANNRVMFWKLPVAALHSPALDVIGQVHFSANGENQWQSVRHDTLCWPYGLSMRDGWMAIADSGNNRVMLWDYRPLTRITHATQRGHVCA